MVMVREQSLDLSGSITCPRKRFMNEPRYITRTDRLQITNSMSRNVGMAIYLQVIQYTSNNASVII